MIIKNLQKSDIQTIGDVQQIKASIDVKNIEFITTLLSSNLYSQPVKSFMREIVSNAWDSHVEAGNTNEPVIIKIESDKVSIRDYGTGLSKKDFEELYCKIGSSSKRESNAYIGAFGLGHLSPLAVSDVVYITSYYNHIARNYIMIKENGTITTNYLGENPTDEHNGLLVSVPMNSIDIEKAKNSLISLVFFPNLYVSFNCNFNYKYNINEAKVVRYKNFSVCDLLKHSNDYYVTKNLWVLLGNVLYPLDVTKLKVKNLDKCESMRDCNICLNINIGEINVTPNRESIIYSENTVKVLSKKYEEALEEIQANIDKLNSLEINDIKEYAQKVLSRKYYDPLKNTMNEYEGFKCIPNNPYKGERRGEEFNNALSTFTKMVVPGFKNFIKRNKTLSLKSSSSFLRYSTCISNKFFAIENNKPISGYTKKYINNDLNYYENCSFITMLSLKEFRWELLNSSFYKLDNIRQAISAEVEFVIKELYDYVVANTTIIKNSEIEDYKKEYKSSQPKTKYQDNSLYTLYKFTDTTYPISVSYKVLSQVDFYKIVAHLKKSGKVILHNGRNLLSKEQAVDYTLLQNFGYKIYWVSNKLYTNLIKYKAQLPKKARILSNVEIDYKKILNNLTKNMECAIVLGKYYSKKKAKEYFFSETLSIISDIVPNFKEVDSYFKSNDKYTYNYISISNSDYYKDYVLKHPESIWLEKKLSEADKLIDLYIECSKNIVECFTLHLNNILCKYLFCRKCIKKGIYINIPHYKELKNHYLIKTIYE